jgi:hypothetical protein
MNLQLETEYEEFLPPAFTLVSSLFFYPEDGGGIFIRNVG